MSTPRVFLCGDLQLDESIFESTKLEKLSSCGLNSNVNIEFSDLRKPFADGIPSRLVDLMEIAAYVYAADSSTKRGQTWTERNPLEAWDRTFRFEIPVRDYSFWVKNKQSLIQILNFLSDDKYEFNFHKKMSPDLEENQLYFPFQSNDKWPFNEIDRVILFSGGLDSLSGAIEYLSSGKKVALVSHRSTPKISKRQKDLVIKLKKHYPDSIIHLPVWVNKSSSIAKDFSQRSRSFLFATLGIISAQAFKASEVFFYENGIVSLNLPVADEVLRARASRTTHPFALSLMEGFFREVLERSIQIENPFLYNTKTEVIKKIEEKNKSELIIDSISCAHTIKQSNSQRHCGTCSQCIDRRVSILAADLERFDLEDDYIIDVFKGERKEGYDKSMAVNYSRHVIELTNMSDEELYNRFSLELGRATRHIKNSRSAEINKLIELHKRFADSAFNVFQKVMVESAGLILSNSLPESSLTAMLCSSEKAKNLWIRYADEVYQILKIGLPKSCKTKKPDNEPHLQEICDGLLIVHEAKLIREFPFQKWSSSSTKPDYSYESENLWVELKYIRKSTDIRKITEDIAADITKYGDSGKKTIFVIYDPNHLVVDQEEFSLPFQNRGYYFIRFIN